MFNLNQEEILNIESNIKKFETTTGTELLVVIAKQSDPYPAASLRFGFISSFLSNLILSYYFELAHQTLWPILFLGSFLFFSWIGHFSWAKKMALSTIEIKRECKEKAIEYFHSLGTQKVNHQATVMLMISILEKRIELLVDEKVKEKISQNDLEELITLMTGYFKNQNFSAGILTSIQVLENRIIDKFSGKVMDTNPDYLTNTIHFKH